MPVMETVAIRHVAFEDLGVWHSPLTARGRVGYLDPGEDGDRAKDADLLVVLGGPIGVGDRDHYPQIGAEIEVLTERLERGKPTIGVCLGAQLIAAALGADVYPAGAKEIGWGLVTVEQPGPLDPVADAPVLHWHGDTFDVPDQATLLASNSHTAHQAFGIDASLALQFHVEVNARLIERWLVGHAAELAEAEIDINGLRSDSLRHAQAAANAGRAVLGRYLDRWFS